MDWYPFYFKDYRRDTRHLSLAECGAYRRLIDEYMDLREPLPDNDAALAAIVRVGITEWMAVAPKVRPFFTSKNGKLFSQRCDQELRAQDLRIARNSENARKAAFARHSKINGFDAHALRQPATLTKKRFITSSESVVKNKAATEKGKIVPTPVLETTMKRKGWIP